MRPSERVPLHERPTMLTRQKTDHAGLLSLQAARGREQQIARGDVLLGLEVRRGALAQVLDSRLQCLHGPLALHFQWASWTRWSLRLISEKVRGMDTLSSGPDPSSSHFLRPLPGGAGNEDPLLGLVRRHLFPAHFCCAHLKLEDTANRCEVITEDDRLEIHKKLPMRDVRVHLDATSNGIVAADVLRPGSEEHMSWTGLVELDSLNFYARRCRVTNGSEEMICVTTVQHAH